MTRDFDERHVLFCALCKIYDNYITPLRSSVFCWKCEYTNQTFLAGMTVTQFNGSKKYIIYEIPMEHWPKFNIATFKEAPGRADPDERTDILMNL